MEDIVVKLMFQMYCFTETAWIFMRYIKRDFYLFNLSFEKLYCIVYCFSQSHFIIKVSNNILERIVIFKLPQIITHTYWYCHRYLSRVLPYYLFSWRFECVTTNRGRGLTFLLSWNHKIWQEARSYSASKG